VGFYFYQETLFNRDSERYVKEGSGNAHLSPYGSRWGKLEGGSFTGDFERHVKEGSGNGASLFMGALRGEPGGRAHLLGTLKGM
jgi:hypothetical protein